MKFVQKQSLPILLLLSTLILSAVWLRPTEGLRFTSLAPFTVLLVGSIWIGWFSSTIDSTRVDIIHALAFSYGLAGEPIWAILISGTGLVASTLLHRISPSSKNHQPTDTHHSLPPLSLHPIRSIFGITLGFTLYQIAGGEQLTVTHPVPGAFPILISTISYSVAIFGLVLLERQIYHLPHVSTRLTVSLGMLIVVPLPIALLGGIGYAILGTPAMVVYCILIGIAAPFIRQVMRGMAQSSFMPTLRRRKKLKA